MTKKLPVVGSTAGSTAFCSEKLEGPEGTFLYVDGNGKITRDNGTLLEPKPNAFSLVQIETCPHSTETCRRSCYVHNLETAQGAVHDLYKHNTAEMKRILADRQLADVWAMILSAWISNNASGGFRWHVSGDVFSLEYAEWIRDVCRESPQVPHWIYTRSFEFLAPLVEVATWNGGNLAINLSCDQDNYTEAVAARHTHAKLTQDRLIETGPRLCYLTVSGVVPKDLHADAVIFPDYNLRPRQFATLAESPWWDTLGVNEKRMVCPVDAHGKAENRRCGPCDQCLK